MTEAQLAKCVEKWRRRIIPDWRVVLLRECPADEDGDRTGGFGRCLVNADLRQIKVWINRTEHPNAREVEETVAHELLHAMVQPLESATDSVRSSLSAQESIALSSRLDAELEPLVERLSRVVVALEHDGAPEGTEWE